MPLAIVLTVANIFNAYHNFEMVRAHTRGISSDDDNDVTTTIECETFKVECLAEILLCECT